jgi:hypothetical protein
MYASGGRQIVLRKVEVSLVEVPDKESRRERVAEILSEAVYAYLKHKGFGRRESPLRPGELS